MTLLAWIPALVLLAWQPSPETLRRLFAEELERCQSDYGEADIRTAQAARDLGMFLREQKDAAGAREALREAVRIDEKVLGPDAAQTLGNVTDLGSVSAPDEAAPLWQRASRSADPKVAARALAFLGQLREMAGGRAEAAKFYRRAVEKEERASGPESAQVAVRLNALSRVVEPLEGIALLERAAGISRKRLGADHAETATLELSLAGLLLKAGQVDRAERAGRDALAAFEKTLGADHPRTALAAITLAHALGVKGDRAAAERLYRRAVSIDEKAYGAEAPRTLSDRRMLEEFLRARQPVNAPR